MSSTDTTGTDGSAINTTGFGGLSALLSGLTGSGSTTASPFDFSGSTSGGSAASFFDPNSLFTSSGGFGGTDQYGQTTQQIQGGDPGAQLQGTDGQQQQQQQQDTSQPAGQQQAQQPGSLLAAVRQMGQPGANPWLIGGGGGVPNQQPGSLNALMRQGPVSAVQMPQGQIPGAQAALPPQFQGQQDQAPVVSSGGYNAIDAQAGQPIPSAPPATTQDATSQAEQAAPTPAGQQAQNAPPQVQQAIQNFLRSPLGQIIDRFTNGGLSQLLQQRGLGDLAQMQRQYGNQVPRGFTAQNMPQWATPEQYAQYQRTGQMPNQSFADRMFPNQGLAPGFQRDAMGNITKDGRPPDGYTGGQFSQPYWYADRASPTSTTGDVFSRGATGVPNVIYGGPGKPATVAGQGELTGTVDKSQLPKPSPDVQRALAQAEMGGLAKAPYPTNTLQGRQANIMATSGPGYTDEQGNRRNGMSTNAIAGAFMNVRSESNWNPNTSHIDQPRYSGQAAYSHGLYQEGGPDWPLFQKFLNGRDWRNPDLQTQFMMQHFAQRNPQAWNRMNNARSPQEAAVIMLNNYLIPAQQYRTQRAGQYVRDRRSANQILAMQ